MLNYILIGVIGLILGYTVLPKLCGYGKVSGELEFYDVDNEENPVMTAVLYEHPTVIRKRKHVIFKVTQK